MAWLHCMLSAWPAFTPSVVALGRTERSIARAWLEYLPACFVGARARIVFSPALVPFLGGKLAPPFASLWASMRCTCLQANQSFCRVIELGANSSAAASVAVLVVVFEMARTAQRQSVVWIKSAFRVRLHGNDVRGVEASRPMAMLARASGASNNGEPPRPANLQLRWKQRQRHNVNVGHVSILSDVPHVTNEVQV